MAFPGRGARGGQRALIHFPGTRMGPPGRAPSGLAWNRDRARDTNGGSGTEWASTSGYRHPTASGGDASRVPCGAGRRCRAATAARGRAFGAGGGACAQDIADTAAPHGGPALPSFPALARARRRGVRQATVDRVRRDDRGEQEAGRIADRSGPRRARRASYDEGEGRSAAKKSCSTGPEGSGNARMNASSRWKSGSN